jgi:hypothetical protein
MGEAVVKLLAFAFVLSTGAVQAQIPSCDKLPYRLGHVVVLNTTDLRERPRPISKKEWKEMRKKQDRVQRECNAFVSKSPGQPVSKEIAYTVEGFAAWYGRCESFCGTDKEWRQLIQKEADEAVAPHK